MAQKTNKQIETELLDKLYEMNGYFTEEDLTPMGKNIAADYDPLFNENNQKSISK